MTSPSREVKEIGAASKFLHFAETRDTGKTKVFSVQAISNHAPLAEIRWYAPWRRYVFIPNDGTLYDVNCMNDMVRFIGALMAGRAALASLKGVAEK